jgi:hypothetical protein
MTLDGYETVEGARMLNAGCDEADGDSRKGLGLKPDQKYFVGVSFFNGSIRIKPDRHGSIPQGMVRLQGGRFSP